MASKLRRDASSPTKHTGEDPREETEASAPASNANEPAKAARANFSRYVLKEVLGGYVDSDSAPEPILVREDISNFFAVPIELERLMWYGFVICLDTFLFIFTFFPIRVVFALVRLVLKVIRPSRSGNWSSSETYELMRGSIFAISFYFLTWVDSSYLYHFIRGQAAIKLYVIFNVLEIFDKLCCSFGQDTLDSLWTVVVDPDGDQGPPQSPAKPSPDSAKWPPQFQIPPLKPKSKPIKKRMGVVMNYLVALVYIFIHSALLFIKVVTLNAAVNAYNNALLTLLISNNFVELKGSVMKNFKDENLFQISCLDIAERFQLVVFLVIVTLYNLNDLSWTINLETLENVAYVIATVFLMEMLVDWIKHAFITKFNHIESEVYDRFSKIIAIEIVQTKQKSIDASHNIARRIGFVPLPLGILLLRVIGAVAPISGFLGAAWMFCLWLCLCTLKILTTVVLLGKSIRRLKATQEADTGEEEKLAKTFAFTKI